MTCSIPFGARTRRRLVRRDAAALAGEDFLDGGEGVFHVQQLADMRFTENQHKDDYFCGRERRLLQESLRRGTNNQTEFRSPLSRRAGRSGRWRDLAPERFKYMKKVIVTAALTVSAALSLLAL